MLYCRPDLGPARITNWWAVWFQPLEPDRLRILSVHAAEAVENLPDILASRIGLGGPLVLGPGGKHGEE
jgi:hypothetical protein